MRVGPCEALVLVLWLGGAAGCGSGGGGASTDADGSVRADGAASRLRELSIPSEGATIYARAVGPERADVVLIINRGPGSSSHHVEPLADGLSARLPGLQFVTYDQRGLGRSSHDATHY